MSLYKRAPRMRAFLFGKEYNIRGIPMLKICPLCGERISDWSMATGRVIEVNNIIYHKRCLEEARIKDLVKTTAGRKE